MLSGGDYGPEGSVLTFGAVLILAVFLRRTVKEPNPVE
jgi:hypothetical protein